jgi:hypothetical protein
MTRKLKHEPVAQTKSTEGKKKAAKVNEEKPVVVVSQPDKKPEPVIQTKSAKSKKKKAAKTNRKKPVVVVSQPDKKPEPVVQTKSPAGKKKKAAKANRKKPVVVVSQPDKKPEPLVSTEELTTIFLPSVLYFISPALAARALVLMGSVAAVNSMLMKVKSHTAREVAEWGLYIVGGLIFSQTYQTYLSHEKDHLSGMELFPGGEVTKELLQRFVKAGVTLGLPLFTVLSAGNMARQLFPCKEYYQIPAFSFAKTFMVSAFVGGYCGKFLPDSMPAFEKGFLTTFVGNAMASMFFVPGHHPSNVANNVHDYHTYAFVRSSASAISSAICSHITPVFAHNSYDLVYSTLVGFAKMADNLVKKHTAAERE